MNTILDISQTQETPLVCFNSEENIFLISGRSLPEDAATFFLPIITWLERYAAKPAPKTTVDIKLEYYNSASARKILEICMLFAKAKENRSEVSINWTFDDDDDLMREAGEEISSLSGLGFNMIEQTS